MADATLRLDLADITGPGRVGEILIRPLSSTYDTDYWTADKPGRIPLKYNDPDHAESDPAYDPEYTILGEGKWAPVVEGALYEFTVVRVNSTRVGETFTAEILSSGNFSDLIPTVPVPPAPGVLGDAIVAGAVASGELTQSALADLAGPVQDLDGDRLPDYRFRVVVNPIEPTRIKDIIVEEI